MERLGDDVRRELARFGPQAGMADLVAAWPAAVGVDIARNAWPARIARDGTVHVHAADAIWAFELGQRAPEIAARLGVARLRFAPGPLPAPAEEPTAADRVREVAPSPADEERAAAIARPVGDADLRALVARTVALALARTRSDRGV